MRIGTPLGPSGRGPRLSPSSSPRSSSSLYCRYEEQLVARWQHTGLWSRLSSLKTPFREPRAAADLDECLKRYAAAIAANDGTAAAGAPRGAVLLSVVGGKVSRATALPPAAALRGRD